MKRLLLLVPLLVLIACSPIEQNARNSAAALNGALTAAQTKFQSACSQDAKQKACVVINQAVEGQNALVTAIEAYCGWDVKAPPADPTTATCKPVKSAQAGLQASINNANLFIAELKGVLQ